MSNLPWFDILVVILLIVGLFRGRKRGMSVELLSVVQVGVVVVAGAYLYKPLGLKLNALADRTIPFIWCYILVYVGFTAIVYMIFSKLRTAIGEKLFGSDMFGRMEYYFGMVAGVLRYAFVILWFMSLIHVKAIDKQREAELAKIQKDNFGSISFPTWGQIQQDILEDSVTGKQVAQHAPHLLMEALKGDEGGKEVEDARGRKQKALDDLMGGKK